ncbi:YegP family protein [Campylobacter geochelonis]|uniref:Uncharacterized conserved protein n=1 Tax=Campylobacter geochelonis TaxID=1780362 RepID=A0A128EDK4_9BACT|nr:DUF1508 domain-containing protein [Campylobacter geochelonis]QKF72155.1 DUF1508 domain-containing protein (tandem domains) [Campylobacter geochelonis]CZE46009.1 Uncharacterized conserved protein [Campylobacter geochelonis]CZE46617.1 Uncharacterized conserved protein [Campylobacter geochelonis]CZE49761.1 Uncharacterized conserved protein [Campylobacter geochelonis]
MSRFIIKSAKDGVKFDLEINTHVVCTSQVYKSLNGCQNGIESVKKNASLHKVDDLTIEEKAQLSNPKFEVYQDKAGGFRFRLKASNGQIVAVSEDFKAKEDCLKVIELIAKEAYRAQIQKA